MKRTNLSIKHSWLYLGGAFLVFSAAVWAVEPRQRGRENGRPEVQTRKEKMKQEAREFASKIDPALRDLLKPVQKNQQPSEDLIQKAKSVLEDTKRHFSVFDDKPKAQFMLLQSWTAFYQDDLTQAMGWSRRACKTNEASQDAWVSQAVFSMLQGKRPALPRIEEPKPRPELPKRTPTPRPRQNNDAVRYERKAQPYSEKGILEFDLLGLKSRVFREQFDRTELLAVSGEKIEYKLGTDTLCLLFWQDDPTAPVDTDDPEQRPQKETPETMQKMAFEDSYRPRGTRPQNTDIKSQRSYFELLMDACGDHPEIKFAQINTIQPKQLDTFLADLPDYSEVSIPTVIAAAPDSNAQRFVGWDAKKPFMAVIDKEGTVRYAGPAADFVPAFILAELTGIEIDLEKQNQSTKARNTAPPMFTRRQPLADPNKPASKKPVAEPNSPAKSTPSKKPPAEPAESPTLTLEDQIRAEKLLQLAQMEIEKSLKLRSNPKRGIEACRKILAQFPNTQYAQQARELLRQVPKRYQEMNDITDEELGY